MTKPDEKRIANYYNQLVDQYGHDPRACDASAVEALEVRYRTLSEVCELDERTVLEVGCGFGDLGEFLKKKYRNMNYCGVDISERMVEEARKIHPQFTFQRQNVLDVRAEAGFDVVMAQGIFYLLGDEAEAKMYRLIKKMFSLCRKATAFSAVSSWSGNKVSTEFYADPVRLVQFCHTLTPRLVLRHDHLPNDVVMYLYK